MRSVLIIPAIERLSVPLGEIITLDEMKLIIFLTNSLLQKNNTG